MAVTGNLGGKVPVVDDVLSSHEQEIYPTTSLDENCIEIEFQTYLNYYVDWRQMYLALKLKLVRGRGYEIYNTKEVKKEHKEEAIAMNTKSAFTGSYTENPFWYQQFDLRQIRILRGGQPNVDYDAADNCRLYVTTMKAMNFEDDIPSIPIDNSKDHYVLVFERTSMQDATQFVIT